ncbi:YdeI/OmpD-associated family protein [Spongiivirga sp. MCCC 1A20706]|uniref:YdeI/OmpD-associated family protein n=1 Tax=Spongiivirga sp. MCCC 1A20706 TaxID=3160963 RepID=UPI0039777B36
MNTGILKSKPFTVTLHRGYLIEIPYNIAIKFYEKGHKRVQLIAIFENNELKIHAALNKRKDHFFIMFGKNNQKSIGVKKDDTFEVQLVEDTTKYGVEMPEELDAVLLSDYDAFKIFESLTMGKKRSIIYMISRFKTSQMRIDKSLLLTENLKRGIRDQRELLKPF